MSFRPSHLAILAAALAPLAAGCGDDKRPVTTTVSSSPATVAVVDSGTGPTADGSTATQPDRPPVSYADAEAAYAGRRLRRGRGPLRGLHPLQPRQPLGPLHARPVGLEGGGPRAGDRQAFDEALRLDPQHRKSLLNSARVLLETSRPREALERVEQAMSHRAAVGRRPPAAGPGALRAEARSPRRSTPTSGRSRWTSADVWAMNNLGLIYIQQDRSDAALPILARAVELRSNSPVFQNNLGTALERTGHFAAAKTAYEAALAADSTYGKAAASLAAGDAARRERHLDGGSGGPGAAEFQARRAVEDDSTEVDSVMAVPSDSER